MSVTLEISPSMGFYSPVRSLQIFISLVKKLMKILCHIIVIGQDFGENFACDQGYKNLCFSIIHICILWAIAINIQKPSLYCDLWQGMEVCEKHIFFLFNSFLYLLNFFFLFCWLYPWKGIRLLTKKVMVRLHFWKSGKCCIPFHCHYSQVHSNMEWEYLFGSHPGVKKICLKIIHIQVENEQKKKKKSKKQQHKKKKYECTMNSIP